MPGEYMFGIGELIGACVIGESASEPTMAPELAATATQTAETSSSGREARSAADTRITSPGNGMPMLSILITSPTRT
jgi:hypothetical protein